MEMLTRDRIVHLLQREMPFLQTEYGVSRVGLFGSFAREDAGPTSDVDLVIEFQRPIGLRFMELIEYLEQIIGRKVEVLTPAGLQGIRIKQIAENINASIEYV